MRLRNPGGLDKAIETVKQVKDQLMNTVPGISAQRKDAFLAWCDQWATPQLGNHFPASEGIFAEIDQSYHRLVMAPPMSERQMNGLLQREWQEWDARLGRVLSDLDGLRAFLNWPGRLVVLDTSALMEGEFFTEYDWHSLDGSLDRVPVRLIVPSLVTEELDELKRRPGERQRAKARRVLTALWDLHCSAPARPAALPDPSDVTIEVLLDGAWHQRMPNNDGEIIDQALEVRDGTGRPVILAACDYTMLYRAAPAGLTVVLMPRPDDA
jgi:rRNA-processing protein FCF1